MVTGQTFVARLIASTLATYINKHSTRHQTSLLITSITRCKMNYLHKLTTGKSSTFSEWFSCLTDVVLAAAAYLSEHIQEPKTSTERTDGGL